MQSSDLIFIDVVSIMSIGWRRSARAVSVRPVRERVVAGPRNLPQTPPVARNREDLRLAESRRGERDMPPVGRKRWTFIGAGAVGDRFRLSRGDVVDSDVEAGARARGVGDLVE